MVQVQNRRTNPHATLAKYAGNLILMSDLIISYHYLICNQIYLNLAVK